jgi:hypothetical protein
MVITPGQSKTIASQVKVPNILKQNLKHKRLEDIVTSGSILEYLCSQAVMASRSYYNEKQIRN